MTEREAASRQNMSNTEKSIVDVVIPVYKPGEEFKEVLLKLKNQTLSPGKIILMITEAEGFSLPDYRETEAVEIHRLSEKEFDHGGTRNKGLSHSTADYVVFLTQDAVPRDEFFLESMVRGLRERPGIAAGYARQLPKADAGVLERCTRSFNYPEESSVRKAEDIPKRGIKTFFLSDVASVYDRKLFETLGGFPEHMIFNEDMLFAHKAVTAGYGIFYNGEAAVYHSHNLSLREQFRRNFDLGVSQADHPEVFEAVSSEKEGGSMVKTVIKTLFKTGKWYWLPYFVCQCGFKFIGYKAGKNYKKLSPKTVRKCSMNKHYWEEQ